MDRIVRDVTTVGVYGFSLEQFVAVLERDDVAALFDIRQRRGVRT